MLGSSDNCQDPLILRCSQMTPPKPEASSDFCFDEVQLYMYIHEQMGFENLIYQTGGLLVKEI